LRPGKLFFIFCFTLICSTAYSQVDTSILKISFPFKRYDLNDSSKSLLNKLVKTVRIGTKLKITGRTDRVGTNDYNDKLAFKRALAVFNYLIDQGIDSAMVIKVEGVGKRKLITIADASNEINDQLNRVVVITTIDSIKHNEVQKDSITVTKNTAMQLHEVEIDNVKTFQQQLNSGAKSIILKNLNFEKGRHVLLKSSLPVLHEVVEGMKTNPNLIVEIQGHICCLDSTEIDAYDIDTNEKALSVNRAKAVYEYLILCGIKANRMSYIGFGSKKKMISPEVKEEDAEMNRRVEFKIIKK
jgi:outer membrane protein OmpA-like peptidoglycan-associated protein